MTTKKKPCYTNRIKKRETSAMKATVKALALRAVILTMDVRLGDSVVCRA